jgi:hypothetical protein
MLTRERFRLLLVRIVVVGFLIFLFATLPTSGSDASAAPPIRKVLKRRHDRRTGPPNAAEVAELRRQVQQDQEKEERQLEDTTPKHVGIRVKIKKEKEKSFKELNNAKWLRELEIEVTNTGTKPIYFLAMGLLLPENRGPDNNLIGWSLLYGRSDLVDVTAPLKPTDVPIKPGETHVFTIAERFVTAWEGMEREGEVTQPKRVQVVFQLVNFGDGTGFWGGTAAPLPHPKKSSRNAPCIDGNTDKQTGPPSSRLVSRTTRQSSLSNISPAFVLANFLLLANLIQSQLTRGVRRTSAVPAHHARGRNRR